MFKILRKYYQAADIYFHSSKIDTYSNAIMEALACGLATVAYETGGNIEQIIPYNKSSNFFDKSKSPTGALIPQFDIQELQNILLELVEKDTRHKELSVNAREYSVNNFNFNQFANNYLKWYEDILASS